MSYALASVHYQPLTVAGGPPPDPGGICGPYTRPTPTAIVTDLIYALDSQSPTAIETNLCATVS